MTTTRASPSRSTEAGGGGGTIMKNHIPKSAAATTMDIAPRAYTDVRSYTPRNFPIHID